MLVKLETWQIRTLGILNNSHKLKILTFWENPFANVEVLENVGLTHEKTQILILQTSQILFFTHLTNLTIRLTLKIGTFEQHKMKDNL